MIHPAKVTSRAQDDERDEERRDLVGQSLHRGLPRLGGLDELRPIWARAVSLTRLDVATHDEAAAGVHRRAPATTEPGPTSTGTLSPGQHRRIDRGERRPRRHHRWRSSRPAVRRSGRRPRADRSGSCAPSHRRRRAPSTSLAPNWSRAVQRAAGTAFGTSLEPPTEQDQGHDRRRDFEVQVGLARDVSPSVNCHRHLHAVHPGVPEEQGPHRPG